MSERQTLTKLFLETCYHIEAEVNTRFHRMKRKIETVGIPPEAHPPLTTFALSPDQTVQRLVQTARMPIHRASQHLSDIPNLDTNGLTRARAFLSAWDTHERRIAHMLRWNRKALAISWKRKFFTKR